MSLPSSWAEVLGRLAQLLGDPVEAEDWVRSAVEARFGVSSLRLLDRVGRQLAFQKSVGALLTLEDEGVPEAAYGPDAPVQQRVLVYRDGTVTLARNEPERRERLSRAFARYFDGVKPLGPDYRIDPLETDRPTRGEWLADEADFGASATPANVR